MMVRLMDIVSILSGSVECLIIGARLKNSIPQSSGMGYSQGNVKVVSKLLKLGVSGNFKIRNPNIEMRNNIKIRIPACHAELLSAEHKSTITNISSGTILNLCTGIAGRSNDQNISGTYTIFRGV